MAVSSIPLPEGDRPPAIDALLTVVRTEGTAAHRYPLSETMVRGPEAARNVADALHHLSLLHGHYPSVIDHAVSGATDEAERNFLADLARRFGVERAFLTKLMVAVGPPPSTSGQSDTETAVLAQHHAIEILAQSQRAGCALGATAALLSDWLAIRIVLNQAAERLSVKTVDLAIPNMVQLRASIAGLTMPAGKERALIFGGQQIVAQHRGLWDLLEARSSAREQAFQ